MLTELFIMPAGSGFQFMSCTPAPTAMEAKGGRLLATSGLRAIVEPLNVQRGAAEQPNLNLRRVGRVIDVNEVPEVQGPRSFGRLALHRPVPLSLVRPPSIQGSILTVDVRAKLSS
jgi:hypothetical protein